MHRREFLTAAAASALTARGAAWNAGPVAHLLPTASHDRFLIKTSFEQPLDRPPRLRVDRRSVTGLGTGTRGLFWTFDAPDLEPSRPYTLQIESARGKTLTDPWTLKTFPAPSESPSKLRLLIYTCAGGHDVLKTAGGEPYFLPVAVRRRILDRALSFQPDALVAIGDHVYWDQRNRVGGRQGTSAEAIRFAGRFERDQPVFGSANERVLERAAGPQIAELYQTRCRSIPVFFIQDDHDYFDNDEATDELVTFPPDPFMMRLGRATRRLYYPEFLFDSFRPAGLAGASAGDTPPGAGECYGTLRWGQLAEILLYDCRRYLTLAGPSAVFIAHEAEQWLKDRMSTAGVAHVVNVPSTPPGWSAGKWGEWYPDILDEQARLGVSKPKPYWQPGWAAQHDRLLAAASAMRDRIPLFISGDLHSLGETHIRRSGDAGLGAKPVVSVLAGPVGTGSNGWPSAARGTRAMTPARIEVDERLPALEENGFTIADFTPEQITLRFFRWSARQPAEAIDTLDAFRATELKR